MKDSRERFTETVENYRRYRPGYPPEMIDWIVRESGVAPGARVVDVGCGTGIVSRVLAASGYDRALTGLFERRQSGGRVEFAYRSIALLWRFS